MSRKYSFSFFSIVVAMTFWGEPIYAQQTRHLSLYFENRVGGKIKYPDSTTYSYFELLHLDSCYVNELGQPYIVTNFKYYISNIKLMDSSGKTFVNKNSYYLINEEDPASHHIELEDVPAGIYDKISFTIGVDSLHNCSGAQSGALDPINGMFWTWNSGYIFMKLEGKSPASKQPGHIFEYHIGGYKAPNNCIRTVTLDLKNRDHVNDEMSVSLSPEDNPVMGGLVIGANVSAILSSGFQLDFSKISSVTDFHNAEKVADNYKSMFRIMQAFYEKK